ncbi:MAG TPA: hypothetical protein VMI10_17985 [Terriglobales bacterium]|nr:hypothetical protein [Terriglobales bacterium]
MKVRQIIVLVAIIAGVWHTSAAQPKKKKIQIDAPPPESTLATASMQSNAVLLDLTALKPEIPLGPQDVLKSYEIAMSLIAEKTSTEVSAIVQAQQINQITREQAEYLIQQRYQIAMMQYQVLSAFHDVLKHDIDEATLESKRSLKAANSDEVLMVPLPISPSGSK